LGTAARDAFVAELDVSYEQQQKEKTVLANGLIPQHGAIRSIRSNPEHP
jgi:hypothetical protein